MIAFVRDVSPKLQCASAQGDRVAVNVALAAKQHFDFVATLRQHAAQVQALPALPNHPNGVFVQDIALLLPEVAIVMRPGNAARQFELASMIEAVGKHRPLQSIVEPGTLHGGDVVKIGRTLYVGETARVNAEGIASLREIVAPSGYEVRPVEVTGCTCLKEACSFVPPHFLVVNPARVNPAAFGNLVVIAVDEREPDAANTLSLGKTTFVSATYPRTEARLREAGITVERVAISELERAGGGISSLCLALEPRSARKPDGDIGLRSVQVQGVVAENGHASQAVIHGGLVYVSPQSASDLAPRRGKRMSVEEQAEESLRRVAVVLNAASSSLSRVVRATIHLAEPKHLERVEPAYAKAFGAHRPARAVVANGALPPGAVVAIEVVAAVTEDAMASR